MADEIRNQNVVNVTKEGDHWRAQIGPDLLGIYVLSHSPATALLLLAHVVMVKGWPFDPSFQPKPDPEPTR